MCLFCRRQAKDHVCSGRTGLRWPGVGERNRAQRSRRSAAATRSTTHSITRHYANVVALKRGEAVYLLDLWRGRVEYPDLRRKVIAMHREWRNMPCRYSLLIEDKGSGMSLIQDLKSSEQIYAIPIKPEGDKTMRMYANTAKIESGAVYVPRRASWLDAFRHEILAFPAGRTDDQVDALSQALTYLALPEIGRVRVGFIAGHY
jgi:predicted phage terminase large subunit-like protein